jgi:hypothetical protein
LLFRLTPTLWDTYRENFLTRKDQKSSDDTSQRQPVWRQGEIPSKFKWSHFVPDLSKKLKQKGLKKWFLDMRGYLALKPF